MRLLKRGYGAVLAPLLRRPLPAIAGVADAGRAGHRGAAVPGQPAVAQLQGTGLPDALARPRRAPRSPRRPGSRCRPAGTCARSTACATAGLISARPSWPTRSTASISARTGSASAPMWTTTRHSTRCKRRSSPTRASIETCRPISASGSRRSSPGRASRSWSASTVPTWRRCAPGREHRETDRRRRRASSTPMPRSRPTFPTSRWSPIWTTARRVGLTPGDIRRQSSTLIASEEVSDIYVGGRAFDVHVMAIPSARDSVTDVENMQLDTPSGKRVRFRRRRCAARPDPERHRARQPVAPHRRRRQRQRGARPDRGRQRHRAAPGRRPASAGLPLRGARRRSAELDAAENRLLVFGLAAAAIILLLLHAAYGSFRLAAPDLRPAADGAGRWGDRGMDQRRRAVAGLAGRLPRGLRHRRPQRDLDGQPLPAAGDTTAWRSALDWCCRVPSSGWRRS